MRNMDPQLDTSGDKEQCIEHLRSPRARKALAHARTLPNAPLGVERASEIFRNHGDYIRTIIAFHAQTSDEVEDIYQEFFLSLVNARLPRDIENMKRYLYRAIANDVSTRLRTQRRYDKRLKVYAESRRYRRQQQDPSRVAEHAEHAREVLEIIEQKLPPREAKAVTCRYRMECNLDETAERMGVNRRSVTHYISAGLRKIKDIGLMRERSR